MEPFTAAIIGFSVGVVRERLYKASDLNLNKKQTAKYVLYGFTREVGAIKRLFVPSKEPELKVYKIVVPSGLSPQEEEERIHKKVSKIFKKKTKEPASSMKGNIKQEDTNSKKKHSQKQTVGVS